MKDDSHLYLDHVQLKARGWSRNLVKKFLIKPDRWETVDHWANFMGKATYFVERVMQEESRAEFQRAFEASRKRRKLTPEDLTVIETERARVNNVTVSGSRQLPQRTLRPCLSSRRRQPFLRRSEPVDTVPHTSEVTKNGIESVSVLWHDKKREGVVHLF